MSESNGDSSQPQSEEIERAVLGSVLLDNNLAAIVTSELFAEDFYSAIHSNDFAAMKAMHERDATEEVNPLSLAEAMRRAGSCVEGIMPTISNLTHSRVAVHIRRYSRQAIHSNAQEAHGFTATLTRLCI